MTNRERMLRILRGGELDRFPFFHQDSLVGSNEEMWEMFGRNKVGLTGWSAIHKLVSQECKVVSEPIQKGRLEGVRNTIYTPKGSIYEEKMFDPAYHSAAFTKHFITEEEDYHILMEYFRDLKVVPDVEHYIADTKKLGDDGIPFAIISRTPYQKLWTELVSMEDMAIHMADEPELVEECCEVLGDHLRQIFDVIISLKDQIDIPMVNIPENITAAMIGKNNYKKYCMPYYTEFKEKLQDSNVVVVTHLDGDLKPIWDEIKEADIDGIDSFTPVPTGDTGVGEALDMWPGKRLFCNFPSTVHLEEPEVVYEVTKKILEEGGHSGRMWIQISENVPEGVWKKSFPAIIQAIDEFGKP